MPERILNIGGFIIKIIFECQTGDNIPLVKSGWYQSVISPFEIKETKKTDFVIKFKEPAADGKYFINKKKSLYVKLFTQTGKNELITSPSINVAQFEIIIERVLVYLSQKYGFAFIMHASAAKINRQAYLFLGDKGSGKSTIISMIGKKFQPLSDDKCLIKMEDDKLYFYQLPFVEKNNYRKKGVKLPVGKFFILKQADRFFIKKVNSLKILDYILNKTTIQNVLSSVKNLSKNVYFLYFSEKDDFLADKLTSGRIGTF